MTDLQTIEAINRHLDQEPTDWTARLELADLYEEAGRLDEARYQRWSVKYERAPEAFPPNWFYWHWWKHTHGKSASIGAMVNAMPSSIATTRQESEADLMQVLIAQGWPAPGVE